MRVEKEFVTLHRQIDGHEHEQKSSTIDDTGLLQHSEAVDARLADIVALSNFLLAGRFLYHKLAKS